MTKVKGAMPIETEDYCDSYECDEDVRTIQKAAALLNDKKKWPVLEKKLEAMQAGTAKLIKLGLRG